MGIGLHADMAAVNVNLWITPDEHNLDGSTGGLVIYDAVADPDMSFAEYNAGNDMFVRQKMLEATEYRNVTIPYRQNRAVIFDSARIHGTRPFSFRGGIRGRRINLTFLFGVRGSYCPLKRSAELRIRAE